jgi:hypothetical protein
MRLKLPVLEPPTIQRFISVDKDSPANERRKNPPDPARLPDATVFQLIAACGQVIIKRVSNNRAGRIV